MVWIYGGRGGGAPNQQVGGYSLSNTKRSYRVCMYIEIRYNVKKNME